MEEVTATREQPAMIIPENVQADGWSEPAGVTSSVELKSNAQRNKCVADSKGKDSYYGPENNIKYDMNAEPLLDLQQNVSQIHSITINTDSANQPNYEVLNAESKEFNGALKTQGNRKEMALNSGVSATRVNKTVLCNENLSDTHDQPKASRVSNPTSSSTRSLPTWTRKKRQTSNTAAPVSESCLVKKRGILDSCATLEGPNKRQQISQSGNDENFELAEAAHQPRQGQ